MLQEVITLDWMLQLRYIIWGPFTILLLLCTGVYMTVRSRFVQLWCFPAAWRQLCRGKTQQGISPWQALCTSLGGTLGIGNVAGVAVAIRLGDAGAVFYMLLGAILGMATKFAEIVLAVRFQVHSKNGQTLGGPMVYLTRGSGMPKLAGLFCICTLLASIGTGSMTQTSAMIDAIVRIRPISPYSLSIIIMLLFYYLLHGGQKRIAKLSTLLVPIMTLAYLGCGCAVLWTFRAQIPVAIQRIFTEAWNPVAAGGGLCGIFTARAVADGFAKGVFSNEAGLGSAPLAHGCVQSHSACEEGVLGAVEVFVDTCVVCLLTALVLLTTGVTSGADGLEQTTVAFATIFGDASAWLLGIIVCFLAITSAMGWGFYGISCLRFFTEKPQVQTIYCYILVLSAGCSVFFPFDTLLTAADILTAPMAFPNLLALWALAPVVQQETVQYLKEQKQCRSHKLRHHL